MLSKNELNYIQKIPKDKVVVIKPFNPHIAEIADKIISKINKLVPGLKVVHMGASGLGISGQGDLDIYALAKPDEFSKCLSSLIEIFGEPQSQKPNSVAWEFIIDEYPVEFYLTDPNSSSMKRQIAVFESLKGNQGLLTEYEALKANMNGKSFRRYQRKKYEFYHRILDE